MSLVTTSVSAIFGGCCGSVATLETLVKDKTTFGPNTNVGNLVTFCQFLFITVLNLPRFITFRSLKKDGRISFGFPKFKPLHVPLRVYLISVLLFFSSSVGNNMIFNYNITIPIHITFRCFGTVLTMITCYLVNGKRYSRLQVGSTLFLTIGALIASLYRDHEFQWQDIKVVFATNPDSNEQVPVTYDTLFIKGILILITSSIMSSLLSAYNEWTYATYGKHWEENMFYCHILSLPLFLISSYNELWETIIRLINSSPQYRVSSNLLGTANIFVSKNLLILIGNLLTQNMCITGVNILASQTGALTLSIVLLVRKFASLLLSVIFFNNKLSKTAYVGILIVFFGAFLYTLGTQKNTTLKESKTDPSSKIEKSH